MRKAEIGENEIKFFLTHLKNGSIDNIMYWWTLIAIFINSVYLYDGDDDGNKKLKYIKRDAFMHVQFRTYKNDTLFGADYHKLRDFLIALDSHNYHFGRWDWGS
jgi:hypothetical protein